MKCRLLRQREDFLDLADQEVRQVPQFRPPIDGDPWIDHPLHSRYGEVDLERMKAALGLNFAWLQKYIEILLYSRRER